MHRVIPLAFPIDLRLTLFQLRRGTLDPTTRLAVDGAWRATRTPDGPATVRLHNAHTGVRAEAWGRGRGWALEHVGDLVGLHDDASAFRPRHPVAAELRRRYDGLRITRSRAVFEALVPSIIEQKVIGQDARLAYARLVQRLGEPAPGPHPLRLPPSPDALAEAPYSTYHECGIERRKAELIRFCARRAKRIDECASIPREDAYARLQSIPGIGPWTAAEVAIVALGDADAVSLGDYHLPHVVAWAFAHEPRGDDARMLELLEPFRGHRGRVIRYLGAAGITAPRRGPRLARQDISRRDSQVSFRPA